MTDSIAPAGSAFSHRAFTMFWIGRIVSILSFQMLVVAVGWQLYVLTDSALDLGLLGIAQFVPMLLLTPLVGHVADRYDNRMILLVCQLAEAAAAAIPVVLVNRHAEGYGFHSVSADNERGIAMAVANLASLGHHRIAHIAGPQDVSTGLSRYQGFLAAMRAHGLAADPALVVYAAAYSLEEGDRCCRELLAAGRGCTAIAAANDMLAVGCYAALEEAGLSCPQDISVVGFNDMPFIDRLRPPLTSVSFPHYQVGTEAGRLILEQIAAGATRDGAGGDEAKVLFLAPELKVRGSTAQPPG